MRDIPIGSRYGCELRNVICVSITRVRSTRCSDFSSSSSSSLSRSLSPSLPAFAAILLLFSAPLPPSPPGPLLPPPPPQTLLRSLCSDTRGSSPARLPNRVPSANGRRIFTLFLNRHVVDPRNRRTMAFPCEVTFSRETKDRRKEVKQRRGLRTCRCVFY